MLFRPLSFSRAIRADEPIWPAVLVAIISLGILVDWWYWPPRVGTYVPFGWYGSCIVICLQVAGFTLLGRCRPGRLRATQRLRLALLVSLYATLFVAAWRLFDIPYMSSWTRATFLWPLNSRSGPSHMDDLLRSLMFYWWWGIVAVFAVVRARPRWCGIILAAALPEIVIVATRLACP